MFSSLHVQRKHIDVLITILQKYERTPLKLVKGVIYLFINYPIYDTRKVRSYPLRPCRKQHFLWWNSNFQQSSHVFVSDFDVQFWLSEANSLVTQQSFERFRQVSSDTKRKARILVYKLDKSCKSILNTFFFYNRKLFCFDISQQFVLYFINYEVKFQPYC